MSNVEKEEGKMESQIGNKKTQTTYILVFGSKTAESSKVMLNNGSLTCFHDNYDVFMMTVNTRFEE